MREAMPAVEAIQAAGGAMEGEQTGREGVDGALGEQQAGRPLGRSQPEAAAPLAGAPGEALEGAAAEVGAGAGDLGAGGAAVAVAAEKDRVAAWVGPQQSLAAGALEQTGIEAAVADEVAQHGGPAGPADRGQYRLVVGAAGGGRVAGGRLEGQGVEEAESLEEGAGPGVQDEVDGPAAAAVGAMVEEALAADGEHRAGAFPALAVAGVAAVAESAGDLLQRELPETVGAPRGGKRGAAHARTSPQALSRWRSVTERSRSMAAAARA